MTRRERVKQLFPAMEMGTENVGLDFAFEEIVTELRALWAVYDEYADAIEQLGGTLPPALDAYERADDAT